MYMKSVVPQLLSLKMQGPQALMSFKKKIFRARMQSPSTIRYKNANSTNETIKCKRKTCCAHITREQWKTCTRLYQHVATEETPLESNEYATSGPQMTQTSVGWCRIKNSSHTSSVKLGCDRMDNFCSGHMLQVDQER